MKKSIFIRILVGVLTVTMLVPVFSLAVSASTFTDIDINYSETNISISNRTTFYHNSVTVYNQYNQLPAKEKSWMDKGGKDGILKGISTIETIFNVCKDDQFSKNDGIDIANGVLGVVAVFAPWGTIAAGAISPILNAFKDPETDPQIEYMKAQFEVVNKGINEIRGDISELSAKMDSSIAGAVSDITEQIGEEIRANEAGEHVYTFMSSGQGNFDYSLLKNYLYGAYDSTNDLASTAFADKLGRLYAAGTSEADIEKCYVDFYRHLTTYGNERAEYAYMLRQYMLEDQTVRVDHTIQRDYYDWLLQNRKYLDVGESPEWLALLFASDLQKTLYDAEGYMLLCNQYFLLKMTERGTDRYEFTCDDGSKFAISRTDAENKIASLSNESRDEEIRVQMAKDIAYILNAENSFTVEHFNGEFYEIINHDNGNFGTVHEGQTVYMNVIPDEICSMFGLDPQKFAFVTNTGKKTDGAFSIADKDNFFLTDEKDHNRKKFTADLYYGNAKIDTHSIRFSLYDKDKKQEFSGGNGTKEYPYLISQIEQMDLMEMEWLDSNNFDTQLYYKLMNDLDYEGKEIYPFGYLDNGTNQTLFQNVFDGNCYFIKNIIIKPSVSTLNNRGLFAKIGTDGEVRNLFIDGLRILDQDGEKSHFTTNNDNGGSIAGINEGLVDNCHVINSTIEVETPTNGLNVGGIVGKNSHGTICNSSVKFCTLEAYRFGNGNFSVSVGGIVGKIYGGKLYNVVAIQNHQYIWASSEGEAFWQTYDPYLNLNAGGVVGSIENSPDIYNIYAEDFTADISSYVANMTWGDESYKNVYKGINSIVPNYDINGLVAENEYSVIFSILPRNCTSEFLYNGEIRKDYIVQQINENQVYDYNQDFLNIEKSFNIYVCQGRTEKGEPCAWVYREMNGYVEGGISPETKCEELPEDFKCPSCGASSSKLLQAVNDYDVKKLLTIEATDPLGRYTMDSYKILGIYDFDTDVASKTEVTEHEATVLFLATMKDTKTNETTEKILSVQIPFVVKQIPKEELKIVELPDKLHYDSAGEEISLNGGIFELVWADGSVEKIEDISLIEISPEVTGEENPTTVILTYKGVSAFYDISIYCEHDFSQTVTTEPTCSHSGKTVQVCSKCHLEKLVSETEKLPHTTEIHNADAASCTEGDTGYTGDLWCVKCEKYVSYGVVIPVLEHSYQSVDGSKHKCSVCGYVAAHVFTSVENDDCIIYTCSTCDCEPISVAKKTDITVSRVVVGNSYGLRGKNDEIAVYVKIFENPGITGVSFRIEFDDRLQFLRAERGDVLATSQTFDVAYSSNGVVGFVAANAYTQDGDGTLVKLIFKLPADAPLMERYAIDIAYTREQFTDGHANVIEMVTLGGCITAVDHLPGDVNSDGVFDMLDTVLLSRYLSIQHTQTASELKKFVTQYDFSEFYADVDLSGGVGLSDLVMMLQFLAGNNVHELSSNQFELFLNPNNGNATLDSVVVQVYDENESDGCGKYPDLPTPQREGYRFDGWYYSFDIKDGDVPVKAGDTVRYESGLEKQMLYARWTEIYYVEYDANFPEDASDCSGSMERSKFEYSKAETLADNRYNVTGWTFKGWALTPDGKVVYQSGDRVQGLVHQGETCTLYAIWEVNSYTVKFNENQPDTNASVTGSMDSVRMEYDKDYYLDKSLFKLKGYEFIGWNTKSDGSGVFYADESMVKNLTSELNGEVRLYAQWTPITFTVAYHANGGSGEMRDSEFKYDEVLRLSPNVFEKTGYRFAGWNTEPDGSGTSRSDKAIVENWTTKNETIELYAQWTPITYHIVYRANGGTGMTATSEHTYDKIGYLTPNAFTRIGYEFAGWTLNADGSGDVFVNNASVEKNLSSIQDSEVILYAKWTPITYTVTYNANGGIGETEHSYHLYDESKALSVNGFSKEGYVFTGWKSESGVTYADQQLIKNLSNNLVLIAQWKPITYNVVYHSNNGEDEILISTHTYDVSQSLTKNTFNRTGYSFVGWNTKADGNGTRYADQQSVLNLLSSYNDDGTHKEIHLYAQWLPNQYKVVYHSNFDTAITSEARYDYDEVFVVKSNTSVGIERVGYSFVGWNTQANGNGTAYTAGAEVCNLTSEGSVVLYAQWKAYTYTVVYVGNGEDVIGSMNASVHTYGSAEFLSANGFSKPGYSFVGWSTDADDTTPVYQNSEKIDFVPSFDGEMITLYAQWGDKVYTVVYHSNDGSGETVSFKLRSDFDMPLMANPFVRMGWHFIGWNTASDGNGVKYSDEQIVNSMIDSDHAIDLYAEWELNTYTVTYYSNGGNGSMTPSMHTYSKAQQLASNAFSRVGYEFVGWNTKADGTGVKADGTLGNYSDNEPVVNLTAVNNDSVTLYAQWKPITYTITFVENGGKNVEDIEYTVTEVNALSFPDMKYDSAYEMYIPFVDWFVDEDCTMPFINDLSTNPRSITLYAKWNLCTIYNDMSTTFNAEAERIIIDWANATDTDVASVRGDGVLSVANTVKELILIGNADLTYTNFSILLEGFEKDQELTVRFIDFNYISNVDGAIKTAGTDSGMLLTLEVNGVCSIKTSVMSGTVIKDFANTLTFIGDGEMTIVAGDGTTNTNGGSAISVARLDIKMDANGKLNVVGGKGGNGYNGACGASQGTNGGGGAQGASGGSAINVDSLMLYNGIVEVTGGNGGNGGNGGCCNPDWMAKEHGGNGGKGGDGGLGVSAITISVEGGQLTVKGGNGGIGGKAGGVYKNQSNGVAGGTGAGGVAGQGINAECDVVGNLDITSIINGDAGAYGSGTGCNHNSYW